MSVTFSVPSARGQAVAVLRFSVQPSNRSWCTLQNSLSQQAVWSALAELPKEASSQCYKLSMVSKML